MSYAWNILSQKLQAWVLQESYAVTADNHPELSSMLEEICNSNGITNIPDLRIMPNDSVLGRCSSINNNAFALPQTNTIVMGEDLPKLPNKEVKTFISHEIGHIIAKHQMLCRPGAIDLVLKFFGRDSSKPTKTEEVKPLLVEILDNYLPAAVTREYEADRLTVALMDGDIDGFTTICRRSAENYRDFFADFKADETDNGLTRSLKSMVKNLAYGAMKTTATHPEPRARLANIRDARDNLSNVKAEAAELIDVHNARQSHIDAAITQ